MSSRYCRSASAYSSRVTPITRRARDLNRSIDEAELALSADATASAAFLSFFSVRVRFCVILSGQFCVGQTPPCDGRCHLSEPSAIVVFALVEPEGLFVEIGVKMNRVNADIGSLESPFEQTPKNSQRC